MSDAVPARKELPKLIVVMASDLDDDGQLDTVLNPHAPRPVLSPSSTLPRFCILERTLSNAHKCSYYRPPAADYGSHVGIKQNRSGV